MKLIKKLKRKISGRAGESIAETLIALLISSLALVMLASMIQTTVSIVKNSETKMNEYYSENVGLEHPDGSKTTTITVTSTGATPVYNISISGVPYEENLTFSSKPVLAYAPADSGGG